jgi:AmmeMemoRadiSam system protein B
MGPRDASVRAPAVAGYFYPDDPEQCRSEARRLLERAKQAGPDRAAAIPGARRWIGGIVPHAGWVCSGELAAETIAAIGGMGRTDVVVVFGAIHTPLETERAIFDPHPRWAVPGGESILAEDVSNKLLEASSRFAVDERFHRQEHAVEVELPFIQQTWPDARVLPIEIGLNDDAAEIGRRVAKEIERANLSAIFLASSDLTHYGPSYRFTPAGIGLQGLAWAKENDRRLLDLVTGMQVERIVPEVTSRANACGGGAIAAMLAACRELGATEARLLRHTNSFEVLSRIGRDSPDNAVGYASVIVG